MAIRRQNTEVRHGSVRGATFAVERPNKTVAARVFIFPGLLGTEKSYEATSRHISGTLPIEVVTMTHGREWGRVLAPMKARSVDCRAVFNLLSNSSLPSYIIGHSLGGADAVHLAEYEKGKGIAGISLEAPVGMSGINPKITNVLDSMRTNTLQLPRDFLAESVRYAARNPVLASAEAIHAKRSSIRNSAEALGDLILLEAYNGGDVVIVPPAQSGRHVVREGYNHVAICHEPEVSLDHALRFMDHVETLAPPLAV